MTPEKRAEDIMFHNGDSMMRSVVVNAIRAAVAEERERCARIAENPDRYRMYWRVERPLGPAIAAAIRAEP